MRFICETARFGGVVVGVVVLFVACKASAQSCGGDCNGDTMVTIDEVIRGVGYALGGAADGSCLTRFDRDASGEVTVDELVAAVGHALNGCPTLPTPTASPTPSPTPVVGAKCGDPSTVDTFFASNRGFIMLYPTGAGAGGLRQTYSDAAGYRLQILVLNGPLAILDPTRTNLFLPVLSEDMYDNQDNEVNVIYNASPAQPLVGYVGVLQCEKATGLWTLSVAAAIDRLGNFVTLSSAMPAL